MKHYKDVFANRKTALIPFFVLGDPTPEQSLDLIRTAVDAGADILELGVPFSDPIADGPTIQKADIRALNQGINITQCLNMIRQIRQFTDIPIGLLMYYNLICHYGIDAFYRDAAAAGVNSILAADLCIDDAGEVEACIKKYGLESVYMVTPNTSPRRREAIASLSTGFIYTVAVMGVTGARGQLGEQIIPLVQSLKKQTAVPICVGFGVSTPDHARQLAQAGADGVIVGSAVVQIIEKNLETLEKTKVELAEFLRNMKKAVLSQTI